MSREASYQIVDEPRPGRLAYLAVQPLWVFLGALLGGGWLAWPWFALNAVAVGSATRGRELWLVAAGVSGSLVAFLGIMALTAALGDGAWLKYALLPITLYKLAIYYFLFMAQSRSAELFTYFGGTHRSGAPVMIAGALLRSAVLDLWHSPLWWVVGG